MKQTIAVALLLAMSATTSTQAFAPHAKLLLRTCSSPRTRRTPTTRSRMTMDLEMPPPTPPAVETVVPSIVSRGGGPVDVRYSEFLKLVNADKVEKVTFSSDGSKLLGVDVDGTRLQIESLPNDPDLLSQLTIHKLCMCVCVCVCVYIYFFFMLL